MNYIVLDLEWNQAADTKTKLETRLLFEIIEIGAVKLNEQKKQIDTFHELIRPQVFRKMNQITSELIHLRMEQLSNCRTFVEVADDFLRWCGEDYIFCTWGNLDLLELQRNMDYYHMKAITNTPLKYYDVQKLFSIEYEDKKKRRTLEYAIDYLQIEKDIAFHRADSDAYYTAMVMKNMNGPEIFHNFSYDTYHLPRNRKEEIHAIFDDYGKYISRGFPDKIAAMADKEVTSTRCIFCQNPMKRKIPWFSINGKHYYSVSYCDRHGYQKGKIRMRKAANEQVYAVKTIKCVDEATVADIQQRREQIRELRKEKRKKEQKKNASDEQ